MTKFITSIILSAVAILPVYAQEQADTLKTQELNIIVNKLVDKVIQINFHIK